MRLGELEILEEDFDLFVALDDTDKIQFLFDALEHGTEEAVIKQEIKLADKYIPKVPFITAEDFSVGQHRLCVTTFRNEEIHLNSDSLKAIRYFVKNLINDGILLWKLDNKKSEFDIYRFFKSYKIIGKGEPFSSN